MMQLEYVVVFVVLLVILFVVFGNKGGVFGGGGGHIYRFHRPGCGYCVKSQGDWNQFKERARGASFVIHDVNLDDSNNEALAKKFSVMGVPTIVRDNGGSVDVYQGDRTAVSLLAWAGK